MPLTIPYNPALILGSLVSTEELDQVMKIAEMKAPIRVAEDKFYNILRMRRKLEMARRELINMRLNTDEVSKQLVEVDSSLVDSAKEMSDKNMKAWPKLLELKGEMSAMSAHIESPVDFNRSKLISLPLSSDSLETSAQYFSFDQNEQTSDADISAIKGFIGASARHLGTNMQADISEAVSDQIMGQRKTHNVQGTLIITANCTHKNVQLFSPFILDVDKAMLVWNDMFPENRIDMDKLDNVLASSEDDEDSGTRDTMNLVSGASFGSSFVGMVHILKSEVGDVNQRIFGDVTDVAMKAGWLANVRGGFGLDDSFINDLKGLLSNQEILSTVSLVTRGIISSLKSQEIKMGVEEFAHFDPGQMMEKLATLHNTMGSDRETMQSAAKSARNAGEMLSIRSAEIRSVINGLADIDNGQNKVLNTNSLMTAFEEYCATAANGQGGVPINFFVTKITAKELAKMCARKYFPDRFVYEENLEAKVENALGTQNPITET